MAHQIALSDEEYAALATASARSGEPIERLVHDAIMSQYAPSTPTRQIGSYQYPTGGQDAPEDEAEDEYLATSIGPGRPLSEIALDDRGPR